jgi:hypothetical protein
MHSEIRRIAFGVFTIGFVLTQLPANLPAQSTFGNIVGVVRAASQSVMPGAQITMHSLDENNNLMVVYSVDGISTAGVRSNGGRNIHRRRALERRLAGRLSLLGRDRGDEVHCV